MKLSIIIPVYNEQKTIEAILKRVHSVVIPSVKKEIIIVDDYSTDSTRKILSELKKQYSSITVLLHKTNQGKGAAIHTGLKKVTGEYILIQDADLEYNPKDLVSLCKPIKEQVTQVVYGTRLKRLPHFTREERTFRFLLHYVGNRFLSLITSMLYFQWITDMETCYKIFPKEALNKFSLDGNGFNFEPEITAKLIKAGYKILEIPISTNPRGYDEGKKLRTFTEGFIALWTLIKYRFS